METFDPNNGQIYTETTSSGAKSMVSSTWKKRMTGRVPDPRVARHAKGAALLQDMAMRACCWNIELFMPEGLAYPGWEHAGKIYRKLKAMDALSLEAWMLFQEAHPNQSELSHQFRLDMHDVTTYWPSIIKSLSTLNASVLTHFCANGLILDLPKLISLTDIPTLTTLVHINASQRQTHPLQGSAIRDWCRAVHEKNAFPKLKMLYLASIPDEGPFDDKVLDHLSVFPVLNFVALERIMPRPLISKSEEYGQWQRSNPARERQLNLMMQDRIITMAEKTGILSRIANRISEPGADDGVWPSDAITRRYSDSLPRPAQPHSERILQSSEVGKPASLTLSCYAMQDMREVAPATWFVRRQVEHCSPKEPPKRILETDDRSAKRRKIRREKQYDVGKLLGSFGHPKVNGSKT